MMIALLFTLLCFAQDPWDDVAGKAGMSVEECKALMDGVEKDQSILDRMARPWEAQPWYKYRTIFLNEERIEGGLEFWAANEATLTAQSEKTGVPIEIIVAIMGVETKWGRVMGNDHVTRALFTIGFYHPRRGTFFRKELGHYLRLATDEGWDLHATKGSYAGAMGLGQFIPSSYREYAVDGDGDGKRDLFENSDDAIASIANYFVEFGWVRGGGILMDAKGSDADLAKLAEGELKPSRTWATLEGAGVSTGAPPAPDSAAGVYAFEVEGGQDYQVGLTNFYVVTRYNHSKLYARAVVDLAQQIRERR